MAPQLWLLRHGEAVPHDSKPDADRELTARGERQSIAAGEALARLGVVFQSRALDGDLTLRQNLVYHAALHGLGGRAARARIAEVLS